MPTNSTVESWGPRSLTELGNYRYRAKARYQWNGYTSNWSNGNNWTTAANFQMPECPPAAVTNLSVQQLNIQSSSTSMNVDWDPPPPGIGTVLGYHVQRRKPSESWPSDHPVTGQFHCNGSVTFCDYATLERGQLYEYRVRAYKSTVQGPWTVVSHTTLYATPSAPGTPTFSGIAPYGYTVNWNNVTNANTGAINYELWEKIGTNPGSWADKDGATSQGLSNKSPATTYEYKVRACNGNNPQQCAESAASTISFPGTPGVITVNNISNFGRDYRLNWTAASGTISTYRLEQSADNGQNWSQLLDQNVLLLQISNAAAGTGYQYRVRAHNSTADGQYTSVFNYWVPQTPTNLGGSANAAVPSLNVSWTGNSLTHHYELQQSTDGGQNWGSVISVSGTSHSPSGVTNGIDYTYRVRACNLQSACSPYTSAVTVRLPYVTPAVPAAPSINVNSSAGTLSASWTAVGGFVQTYKVEQSTDGGSTWSLVQNTSALSYVPTNLTTGLTYRLRIAACNVDACSNFGASASAYLPHATPPLPNLSTGGFIGVIDNVPTYGAGHAGEYTVTWSTAGGVVNTLTAQEQEPGGSWQAASVTALNCGASPNQCSYNKPPNNSGALQVYRYRAQACNSDNCSGWKEIAVQVNFYITPGIPATFTISQGPTTAGAYTLRWTRPAGSAELHYYYLDNSDTPTNPDYPSIPHDPNQAYFEHAFTGGVSGQTYNFRVRACYLDDNGCDAYTAPLAVYIPYAAPGQPGALSHSNLNVTTGSYTLNWSAASGQVNNYELQRQLVDGQWVAEATTTSTNRAITGQANGETSGYRVRACNADACGNYSAAHAVYVPHLTPGAPTSLVLQNMNAAGQSLSLTWTAPGSGGVVQSYEVQQSANGGSTWQTAGSTASTAMSLIELSNGTTYQFRVRACNVDACSAYTASLQIYLPYVAPGMPGALSHDADENNPAAGAFTMHWIAPATIVGAISPISHYRIDYSANGGSTWQAAPTGGAIPGQVNVTNPAPNAAAAATLSGLATAASYGIRVRACNVDACGANTAAYQVYLQNPPPGAPALQPTNPSPEDYAARRFTVQWTAPASGTVHHYQIESYAGINNGIESWLTIAETPATSYTFTDRSYGESYRYRVQACSEAQSAPAYCSAWVTTTPDIRLKYPTPNATSGIAVGEVDQANGNYTLSWNGVLGWAPEYRYELQEKIGAGNWQPLTEVTDPEHEFAVTGRAAGTYGYQIRACNPAPEPANDCSAWSPVPEKTVTILPTPTAPASLTVDDGNGESCQFNLDWTSPTGGQGTYHYQVDVMINSGSWNNLAWTTGTSHNMIVNHNNNGDPHIFRVRARTLSNGQYSPWGAWNTGSSVTTSCDHDQLVAHDGLYISAPRYSESGQYTVITQYVESWAPGLETRHMVSTNNGAGWGLLGWVQPPTALNTTYNSSTARPTARYVYAAGVCDADLVYDPDPNYVCWSGYTDPPWEMLTTNTTVLRDPGSVGPLQIAGLPNPIDSAYIVADGQFTLDWQTPPNAPGPATYKYEIQYKPDSSTSADAWVRWSEETTVDKQITLSEFGVAFDFRVRACAYLDDYVNCDAWSELAYPVKQSIGPPRMAVNTYPADGELVIYDKRVPLQWLAPWDMAEGGIHHYEISLRSKQISDEGEYWIGPDVLSTPAPVNGSNSNPPVQQDMVEVEQGGQKEFLIRACGTANPTSCGQALVFEITVVVPPDPPAEPAGLAGQSDPDPWDPIIDGKFNGALSGQFSVQPSGAAGYTLPIIVPPGSAGVQPKLSLNYSSQAGNGIAGMGWSIGGLSMITRCNKTMAQDGEFDIVDYTNDDAYCLDGQRLVEIATNIFRTEKNDFRQITKKSGGACGSWFEVKTQANEILQYGYTGDACVNALRLNTPQNVMYGWALNKVTDVSGNYMAYKYQEDTAYNINAFAIRRIEYTGHTSHEPYTAVDFQYETGRPDPLNGFQGGVGTREARRLTKITTGIDPNYSLASSDPPGYGVYALNYQADGDLISRLVSIGYCAKVGAVEPLCMEPLEFQWSSWQPGWQKLAGYGPPHEFSNISDRKDLGARIADLDNDGLPDLLYSRPGFHAAYRNTGSGWQSWGTFTPPVDFVDEDGQDLGTQFADITGDGRPELLTSINNGDDTFRVYKNTISGWDQTSSLALPAPFRVHVELLLDLEFWWDQGLQLVDLNADGLADLIQGHPEGARNAWRNTGSSNPRWAPWSAYEPPVALAVQRKDITNWPISHPEGWEDRAYDTTGWLADFNGDSLPDLLYKLIPHADGPGYEELIEYRLKLNTGTGWSSGISGNFPVVLDYANDGPDAGIRLADLNGDGLPDVVRGNHSDEIMMQNTGLGFMGAASFAESPVFQTFCCQVSVQSRNLFLMDINYDGRSDVLFSDSNGAWLNTKDGWLKNDPEILKYRLPVSLWNSTEIRFSDVNGDGITDLLSPSASTKAWTLNSGKRHIIAVTDGLDNITKIKYKAITDKSLSGRSAAIYSRTEEPVNTPEQQEMNIPLQVVDRVTVNDGIGGELTTEYAYQGMTAVTGGRGLQGFEKVTINSPDGKVTTTRYAHDYPYTGMPLEVVTTYNGELLSRSTSEYCHADSVNAETPGFISVNPDSPCPDYEEDTNQSLFVYVKKTAVETYQLNSALTGSAASITVVSKNKYGAYGYLKEATVTTDDDQSADTFVTHTLNTYDSTFNLNWGRLKTSTVTQTTPNASSWRATEFAYNAMGLLWKEIVEPNGLDSEKLLTMHAYDAFGNRVETTVCAAADFGACAADPNSANAGSVGRSTTMVYDSNGRYPITVINALDQSESREYQHPLGLQTKLTGPNGLETTWAYDPLGRKLSETTEFGTTTFQYYKAEVSGYVPGSKYRVESHPSEATPSRVYYDGLGRKRRTLFQSLHGEYVAADIEYDRFGRVWRESRPYFDSGTTAGDAHWTVNYFDGLGRATRVDVPLGDIDSDGVDDGVAVSTTDYQGFDTIITDPKSRRKLTRMNALNQTVRMVDDLDGKNIPVDYEYDSQGNLAKTTVDGEVATAVVIDYDKRGNKESMNDPDMGEWSYSYNGYGELVSQTDAKGQITLINYDKLGRMIKRVDDATGTPQTSAWVYDTAPGAGIGKLHSECLIQGEGNPQDCLGVNPESKKTYSYTDRGQVEETEYFIDTHGWEQSFTSSQTYDAFGRVQLISYPDVGGGRLTVENRYSPFGGLWYVLDVGDPLEGGDESVYWIADMVDVRGKVIQETLRNQNIINNSTNVATGWLQKVESWDASLNMIQQTRYAFDTAGNVLSRERFRPWIVNPDGSFQAGENEHVAETFIYDSLDRLLSATVTRDAVIESTKSYDYNDLGNFDYKDEDTPQNQYGYNTCGAGPHAVCSAKGSSFTYDANGNMVLSTGAKARTVEYSASNKPTQITENGVTVNFVYGADRARVFKKAVAANGNVELTWYVGLGAEGAPLYEQTAKLTGGQIRTREHLHFIYAGGHHNGQAFAVRVQVEDEDNTPAQPNFFHEGGTEYYHRDHLGSVIAITGNSGAVEDTRLLSFDAWGKRRNADWSEGSSDPEVEPIDQYTLESIPGNLGYTGHESIPEVGLIHMNGRVYDPELGVFLSADPHIQAASLSQNYNRYSYVLNNPIKYNDPSGYWVQFVITLMVTAGIEYSVTQLVILFVLNYAVTGDLKSAMLTTITAGVTHGIGDFFGPVTSVGEYIGKALVHGLVQGIFTEAGGGKFREGFAGGFAGSLIGNPAGKIQNRLLSTVVAAMVGGTVSELSGGKFANGAKAAAMVHLFNDLAHDDSSAVDTSDLPDIELEYKGDPRIEFYVTSNTDRAHGTLVLRDGWGQVVAEVDSVSGSSLSDALPYGSYVGDNLRLRGPNSGQYHEGMTCSVNMCDAFTDQFGEGNFGWSLDLTPNFETNRTLLRIHPDGGSPNATGGCVGTNCAGSRNFYRELRNYFNHGTTNIPVDVFNFTQN